MLKRIFENIISNAIKYTEQDFNIKLFRDGTIKFINKTDGIDIVSLEKVFNRYYAVINAKKSNDLDLSTTKQLIELNGGKIEAQYQNNNLIIIINFYNS